MLDLTASLRDDDVGVAAGQVGRWTNGQVGRWTSGRWSCWAGQLLDGLVLCFCCLERMILSDFSLTFYVADVKFTLIVSFWYAVGSSVCQSAQVGSATQLISIK